MNLLLRWALSTVALWLTVRLGVGVSLPDDGLLTLLVTAIVIGLVNAVVRPIMVVLTLPLTVISLGLFLLVVNGLALAIAAAVTPLELSGLGGAILGALVLSVLNTLLTRVFVPKARLRRR